jgi:hypothetical protein
MRLAPRMFLKRYLDSPTDLRGLRAIHGHRAIIGYQRQ